MASIMQETLKCDCSSVDKLIKQLQTFKEKAKEKKAKSTRVYIHSSYSFADAATHKSLELYAYND